ncbi:hypothetical protein [Corynebacterium striatum]|uniref:hypothetical protein n=1 Tax=Corynebacterium striatum TaxID=43770 RepID=UPI0027B9DFD1|nr:hypothetical protein [Corynebacterium striatum]
MTEPTVIFNMSLEIKQPRLVESVYSSKPVEDWDHPVWLPVDFPVSVQHVSTAEGGVERPQVSTSYFLVTPPGTDIPELNASSVIRVGGTLELEVRGAPARWPDPWKPGVVHHLEAELEGIDG